MLAQILAKFTVKRFNEPQALYALRDERALVYQSLLDEERRSRDEKIAVLGAGDASIADGALWREMALEIDGDNKKLQQENIDLRAQVAEVEAKCSALAFALNNRGEGTGDAGEDDLMPVPKSVHDAVVLASEFLGDGIVFGDDAYTSAGESNFKQPTSVFEAFRAMDAIAQAIGEGGVGRPMKDAFREFGIDYRQGVAKTTPRKLREQYLFEVKGQPVVCEEHISFGSSYDPAECLRIYFSSKQLQKHGHFLVGHVGRHLDTKKTS